ncbi:MAG: TPM domain-containing protein [Clostridiales bacterium]|nr:TPM domain-containing protein [Clostridiales bacterium]
MKRVAPFLALILLLPFLALSQTAAAPSPAVSDQAAVLDTGLAGEINRVSDQAFKDVGVRYRLVTKHFLGGAGIQAVADQALAASGQPEDTILLLVAVGEENYAVSIGGRATAVLGQEQAESLLSSRFKGLFDRREYDRSAAAAVLAFNDSLYTAKGLPVPAGGGLRSYAGQAAAPSTPAPEATQRPGTSWLDSILPDEETSKQNADRYAKDSEVAYEGSGKGMSLFQIALIGFVLYKIFGKRRSGRGGCGPLGWIFGTWGASKFFGWRK